jgi:hypothetical protein
VSCPACGNVRTGVRKTSRAADGTIVRRRFCRCGHRWTTRELLEARVSTLEAESRTLAALRVGAALAPPAAPQKPWQPDFTSLGRKG